MSNRFKKIKVRVKRRKMHLTPPPVQVKHNSFNIYTRDGHNRTEVKSPYPMTLEEAQVYFDALCIGAND